MVAPTAFVFNEQTAADNTFMHASAKSGSASNAGVRHLLLHLHHAASPATPLFIKPGTMAPDTLHLVALLLYHCRVAASLRRCCRSLRACIMCWQSRQACASTSSRYSQAHWHAAWPAKCPVRITVTQHSRLRLCKGYVKEARVLLPTADMAAALLQHADHHGTPDAVFPNNWFSTHAAGEAGGNVTENTLVLYPMKTPNRWTPAGPASGVQRARPGMAVWVVPCKDACMLRVARCGSFHDVGNRRTNAHTSSS